MLNKKILVSLKNALKKIKYLNSFPLILKNVTLGGKTFTAKYERKKWSSLHVPIKSYKKKLREEDRGRNISKGKAKITRALKIRFNLSKRLSISDIGKQDNKVCTFIAWKGVSRAKTRRVTIHLNSDFVNTASNYGTLYSQDRLNRYINFYILFQMLIDMINLAVIGWVS